MVGAVHIAWFMLVGEGLKRRWSGDGKESRWVKWMLMSATALASVATLNKDWTTHNETKRVFFSLRPFLFLFFSSFPFLPLYGCFYHLAFLAT